MIKAQWRLVFSKNAKTDLVKILQFLFDKDKKLAKKEEAKIQHLCKQPAILVDDPKMVPREPWRSLGLFQIKIGVFQIFYTYLASQHLIRLIRIFYEGPKKAKQNN